jgi:hypothetical protein
MTKWIAPPSRGRPEHNCQPWAEDRLKNIGEVCQLPRYHNGSEIADYGARVLAVGALAFELFHTLSGRLTIGLRLSTAGPAVGGIVKNPTAR